ncbi:MAG: shikimate dehydrogenase [Oligoflexales bacterium]
MSGIYHLGLLGSGISFSLSPKIHLHSAKILGLACEYKLYDIEAAAVKEFLANFWEQGGHGLNVTTPHKELVAQAVDSPLSSVNTLYRKNNAWSTASTDGEGFARSVARMGRGLETYDDLLILGSGGASMAILTYLESKAISARVHLLRRSLTRDLPLQQELSQQISFHDFTTQSLADCLKPIDGKGCLLIQASSAPLKGEDLSQLVPALNSFKGDVVDLVYGRPSALYYHAKDQGLNCQEGLPMLIEQARLAQELWWGESAGFDEIHKSL